MLGVYKIKLKSCEVCGWEMNTQCHLILYQKRDEVKQAGTVLKLGKEAFCFGLVFWDSV